jgi:hypothetical protein
VEEAVDEDVVDSAVEETARRVEWCRGSLGLRAGLARRIVAKGEGRLRGIGRAIAKDGNWSMPVVNGSLRVE